MAAQSATTATATTTWSDVASVNVETSKSDEAQNRLTIVMQNNDGDGAVDFRVRATIAVGATTTDPVTVETFLNRSSGSPATLITDHEFQTYTVQAKALSGTRSVTVATRIYRGIDR